MSKATVKIELTKAELEIVLRGVTHVMCEENTKSGRRFDGWKATRRFVVSEQLFARLEGIIEAFGRDAASQEGSR